MKLKPIYLNTTIATLLKEGLIDKNTARACGSANPRLATAGDIKNHLAVHGSFTEVPGCRRPGRISRALENLAKLTLDENEPHHEKAKTLTDTADFPFLSAEERASALNFKREFGHLPMFAILSSYLRRPSHDRKEIMFASYTGLDKESGKSLAEIGSRFDVTPERVRQILLDYTIPEGLDGARLWNPYANHSTYFINENSEVFKAVIANECSTLPFRGFAAVIRRVLNFDYVDRRFLARRGWVPEIEAWAHRLQMLRDMTRTFSSKLSIDGLSMGGKLDSRLKLIVVNQIVPQLGLEVVDDNIILPANA